MPPLTTTMVPARELRVGDFATSDGASGVIRNVHSVQNRLLYVSIDRPMLGRTSGLIAPDRPIEARPTTSRSRTACGCRRGGC
jgi:hypothetical protein